MKAKKKIMSEILSIPDQCGHYCEGDDELGHCYHSKWYWFLKRRIAYSQNVVIQPGQLSTLSRKSHQASQSLMLRLTEKRGSVWSQVSYGCLYMWGSRRPEDVLCIKWFCMQLLTMNVPCLPTNTQRYCTIFHLPWWFSLALEAEPI